jgi:hypothetical protein
MKTFKEIKKHFKNAKEVRCLVDRKIYKIGKIKTNKEGFARFEIFWVTDKYVRNTIKLSENNELAEIISYKKPKFEYGDKVVASDYKDFSISVNCRYACKNLFNRYVVFTDYDYDYAFVYKYIKKTI